MGTRVEKPLVVVAYKKSKRTNAKVFIQTFENTIVDEVIDGKKKKPLIPHEYEIVHIGIGSRFEEEFKKKYQK